ncbi:MAG: hypothetical protein ACD_46C00714G0001 [uncultured bacterium]|nr:MAG: hypothetical protein ACD_46C00714G0001 [uncultured bacterium]
MTHYFSQIFDFLLKKFEIVLALQLRQEIFPAKIFRAQKDFDYDSMDTLKRNASNNH